MALDTVDAGNRSDDLAAGPEGGLKIEFHIESLEKT